MARRRYRQWIPRGLLYYCCMHIYLIMIMSFRWMQCPRNAAVNDHPKQLARCRPQDQETK